MSPTSMSTCGRKPTTPRWPSYPTGGASARRKEEDDDEENERKKKRKRGDMEHELAGPLSDSEAAEIKREAWSDMVEDLENRWRR